MIISRGTLPLDRVAKKKHQVEPQLCITNHKQYWLHSGCILNIAAHIVTGWDTHIWYSWMNSTSTTRHQIHMQKPQVFFSSPIFLQCHLSLLYQQLHHALNGKDIMASWWLFKFLLAGHGCRGQGHRAGGQPGSGGARDILMIAVLYWWHQGWWWQVINSPWHISLG